MSRSIEIPFVPFMLSALVALVFLMSALVEVDTTHSLPVAGSQSIPASSPFGPSDWHPESRGFTAP